MASISGWSERVITGKFSICLTAVGKVCKGKASRNGIDAILTGNQQVLTSGKAVLITF